MELHHLSVAELAGKHVVIWGAGTHGGGLAAIRHCLRAGAKVSILDRRPPRELPEVMALAGTHGIAWHLGESRHPIVCRADIIIASPAIPPAAIQRLPADAAPVVCPEALFLAEHRGPRIAVTGTKGKSTTAAACGTLLDWPVGGNSHPPLLDVLEQYGPTSPIVCELSSFQLWHLKNLTPHFNLTLLTNLHQDHLDWHSDLQDYHASKLRLLDWSSACAVHSHDRHLVLDHNTCIPVVTYSDKAFETADEQHIAPITHLHLPGQHNKDNVALALSAALHFGLDPVIAGIRVTQIQGLPHRLQRVHQYGSIIFIDDSIATTPEATLAGLDAISGPLTVILGGADKGSDFAGLASGIHHRGAHAVCIGQTGPRISDQLQAHGLIAPCKSNLEQAIKTAISQLPASGGTVLLSPACSSTDMFRDFSDRGDCFTHIALSHVS